MTNMFYCNNKQHLIFVQPIAVAAWSKAWNVFTRSNSGIVGLKPTQGMDVCSCLFCVCVWWGGGDDLYMTWHGLTIKFELIAVEVLPNSLLNITVITFVHARSDYHLFTYLKNWLGSQCLNNNELMVPKCGRAHRWQASLTQVYQNLLPDMTSASIPTVTMLRRSLGMYIFLLIINFFFSLLVLWISHWKLFSE
jgi:hypothetical protein